MNKNISNPLDENHAKTCVVCDQILIGKQSKFCSRKCHNQSGNKKLQNYEAQKKRGMIRKIKLINMLGGKCESCGYNHNYAALSFHHKNPQEKSFQLDLRQCSNNSWEKLVTEVNKCQLLCLRCHAELHNPDFCLDSPLLSSLL
jgi:predicted nucleic acid-binding Zn ribbon protein